ncbi:uncharacterized protein PAC_05445 [Phialocephala subalpina]|uniref:Carboxymuconolactone decarboxylase-like domain-containing protein n=1 Tax=Phialocephala subalpina TaxID=576137 RepID=A0A1L7WS13_9HELO|nr:uncharacterized protein PAC_05445 [Phialocephala subalpina]
MSQSQPSIKEDFDATYTAANKSKDATPYDYNLLVSVGEELNDADPAYLEPLSYALISVMLCAQRRGDAVAPWFSDLVKTRGVEEAKNIFSIIREAIAVIYPFVGLPNCVPACLGLVGVLRGLGIDFDEDRRRADVQQGDYLVKGLDTRKKIYRGVGNPEVHWMLQKYFPDMTYATNTFIFGYLATGSLDVFELRQTELIIAGAILAMGATRQARSHCKASMQVGNSEKVVAALVEAARRIACWNMQELSEDIVVSNLAQELKDNLAKEEGAK